MRCSSCSSTSADSYRAGSEIGEGLAATNPEVVLLFASITYEDDLPSLFEGLIQGLNRKDVILFGCTGDGIYETRKVSQHGICALGINSEGAASWAVEVEPGVGKDSFGAARACARRSVARHREQPSFVMVLADGVRADGTEINAGVASAVPTPFLGGLAGDDRKFSRSWVFVNGEAHQDSIAILTASGDLPFLVNSASGWSTVGEAGVVEESRGSTLLRISGNTPLEFMRQQLGKSPGEVDLGIVPFASIDPVSGDQCSLRTPSHLDQSTGSVTTFGSIREGTRVKVCLATQEDILTGVSSAIAPLSEPGFSPKAAIIVSCAGRRWLLDEACRKELDLVLERFGADLPVVGFPSFGEIGPLRKEDGSYSDSYFHNVTFVVCVLGTRA